MQEILVYLVVVCALAVTFRRYAPKSLQRTLRVWTQRIAGWLKLRPPSEVGAQNADAHTVHRVSPDALRKAISKTRHARKPPQKT